MGIDVIAAPRTEAERAIRPAIELIMDFIIVIRLDSFLGVAKSEMWSVSEDASMLTYTSLTHSPDLGVTAAIHILPMQSLVSKSKTSIFSCGSTSSLSEATKFHVHKPRCYGRRGLSTP